MTVRRLCLMVVAGILTAASVGAAGPLAPPCTPDPASCEHPAPPREPSPASEAHAAQQHPCDWVETCQLPCGGEGTECCHAEWNCPPDASLPRC